MKQNFEQWVRNEIASKRHPTSNLLIEWGIKAEESSVPLQCMTLVLTYLDSPNGWEALKEAALEALEETPADATTVLDQATRLANWPKATYQKGAKDNDFLAIMFPDMRTYMSDIHDSKHQASIGLLKAIYEDNRTPDLPEVFTKKVVKSPTSRLFEYCQKTRICPPKFNFKSLGKARVVCKTYFGSKSYIAEGYSKQDSKGKVCTQILVSAY